MNRAPSLIQSVIAFVGSDTPLKSRVCFLTLLGIMVGVTMLLVWTGPTVVLLYCHDTPIFLDGAWRILHGQIPHTDFYTPLGPLTLLAMALGMWFTGPVVNAITCANTVVFLAFSIWAWLVARSRLSAVLSLLFTVYIGLMIVGTSSYGHDFNQLSHAALYNRYGTVLTAMVFIECLTRSKNASSSKLLLGGVSSGALLALLLFLKVNYFVVAALTVVVGAVLVPQSRTRWLGLCLGALLVSALMLSYLRFDILSLYHDMVLAIRARGGRSLSDIPILPLHALVFDSMFLMLTLWIITPTAPGSFRSFVSPRFTQGVFVLFLIFIQALLSVTNNQPRIPSLFPVGAILILAQATTGQAINLATLPATLLLSLFFVVSAVLPNIESLVYSAYLRSSFVPHIPASQKFTEPPMKDLYSSDQNYVTVVNDGCQLLRRETQPSERVLALDFSNPFSYALQRPPPKGDALWWHTDMTFNKNAYPDPDTVFRDASIVMIPKAREEIRDCLIELYGNFLKTHYAKIAESQHWVLVRRHKEQTKQ